MKQEPSILAFSATVKMRQFNLKLLPRARICLPRLKDAYYYHCYYFYYFYYYYNSYYYYNCCCYYYYNNYYYYNCCCYYYYYYYHYCCCCYSYCRKFVFILSDKIFEPPKNCGKSYTTVAEYYFLGGLTAVFQFNKKAF